MNRRKFLHHTTLTGIVVSAAGLSSFSAKEKINALPGNEFDFKDDFDLTETTIDILQQKMQAGHLTSEAITRMYLKRIQDIDKKGPALNAVIEINPDALQIARSLDNERKAGKVRGPLHGIPILVKDNINTGDKMMTTAGSLALKGNHAAKDAYIIELLRIAGAVLLGKTNLSEWANFRSTRSTSAWSSRGGQTRCPYILDRNPSGSSAGSGSAAAANLCTLAIGTETDGSIVSPASVNGLVGIKPTVGLWSRWGIIPISATQDTAGPMARTVKDAAILLGALTGVDNADATTSESRDRSLRDYTKFLDSNGLKGKRIGIEKSHLKGHEGITALYNNAITLMKSRGATIVEVDILKPLADLGSAEFTVLLYEFKDGLNQYLSASNSNMKSLQDVIKFNSQNENSAMPFFKQETLINADTKGDLSSKEYTEALAKTLSSRKIIADLIKQNNLDALCGVTNGLACCIDLANGDYDTGFSLSTPAAISGFPHITVPMGFVHDLPIGISFFSTAYTEPALISIAYAYEQGSKHRKAPMFKGQLLS
ncbi:MAG TPA: amidase [Chitinophagaceae bacterium]|nr:amidase [Chitinophagaceae bacterium]